MAELPIACSLSLGELFTRRKNLLPGIVAQADMRESVNRGYRWRFSSSSELITALASMINAERRCCQFLRFALEAEPEEGPVWLMVTGPEGTQEFLNLLTSP
jgi:hypothetical protein